MVKEIVHGRIESTYIKGCFGDPCHAVYLADIECTEYLYFEYVGSHEAAEQMIRQNMGKPASQLNPNSWVRLPK